MATAQRATIQFNRKGFLYDFNHWSRDTALELAGQEGLTLTQCHWKVIEFLRDYYATHAMPPSPRVVVKSIGHEVSAHVPCTRRHFQAMFPRGGIKQACRIAGLPDYYLCGC